MMTLLTIVYVFVCTFLIFVVLLQAGRGGGMGAAFGGGSQSVFGGAGAGNFLTRLTVIMAALFMVLSATLAFLSSSSDKALDKASQAIKLREEARRLGAKDKKPEADKGAQSSTSTPATTPAAPTSQPAPGAAPEEAQDVDREGTEPLAPVDTKPSEPAPAAPSAP